MKILIVDPWGDCLDLALRAMEAGHEVVQHISEKKATQVGKGLVRRTTDYTAYLGWADLTILGDNIKFLRAIDAYRAENPSKVIFGPNGIGAKWEIDRLLGMKILDHHGIKCPPTYHCHSYDEAVAYVKKRDTRLVCKPCSDADKALSYVSKTPEDMLFMLGKWNKAGEIKSSFILQDFIPGHEFAVGSYIGKDGFGGGWEENFEHKPLMGGDVGPNTGEMGTVIQFVERSKLANIVLRPLERALVSIGYTGSVDVNCIIDDKGKPWPLEFTMRMGYPALQIQTEAFPADPVKWMYDMATGKGEPKFKSKTLLGVSVCIPPFPYDHAPADLAYGFPIFGVTESNRFHLHPYHIQKGKETEWATAGLYGLVVTSSENTVQAARDKAYATLKELVIPGSPIYRKDIGEKLAYCLPPLHRHGFATQFQY